MAASSTIAPMATDLTQSATLTDSLKRYGCGYGKVLSLWRSIPRERQSPQLPTTVYAFGQLPQGYRGCLYRAYREYRRVWPSRPMEQL
jgi:hypothetical protein